MKKHPTLLITTAIATVYFGLTGSLLAVPTPPANVPDGGSTGLMLSAVLGGLGFLRWKFSKSK